MKGSWKRGKGEGKSDVFFFSTHRRELPQLDAGGAEDLSGGAVHAVALAVDDLGDADLDDLDAAGEAGAGVAVEDAAGTDALAAGLEQGVLLGVEAQAGGEGGAAGGGVARVAARAPAASTTMADVEAPASSGKNGWTAGEQRSAS